MFFLYATPTITSSSKRTINISWVFIVVIHNSAASSTFFVCTCLHIHTCNTYACNNINAVNWFWLQFVLIDLVRKIVKNCCCCYYRLQPYSYCCGSCCYCWCNKNKNCLFRRCYWQPCYDHMWFTVVLRCCCCWAERVQLDYHWAVVFELCPKCKEGRLILQMHYAW